MVLVTLLWFAVQVLDVLSTYMLASRFPGVELNPVYQVMGGSWACAGVFKLAVTVGIPVIMWHLRPRDTARRVLLFVSYWAAIPVVFNTVQWCIIVY